MPDDAGLSPADRHNRALAALDAAARAWGGESLNPSARSAYAGRGVTHGWRLPVDFSDGRRRLDLLVDGHFPRSALRVALVDRPPFLTWPHVEKDGALCLLGGAAEVSAYDPVGVAETLLGDAASLIEDLIAGRLDADFEAEFLSYWDWSKTIDAPPVRSLLATQGPSRSIRVWRGRAFYLLAESDADLQTWLRNFDPGRRDPFQFEEAVLVWRPTPPSPEITRQAPRPCCPWPTSRLRR